jgi:hypothetical protein
MYPSNYRGVGIKKHGTVNRTLKQVRKDTKLEIHKEMVISPLPYISDYWLMDIKMRVLRF